MYGHDARAHLFLRKIVCKKKAFYLAIGLGTDTAPVQSCDATLYFTKTTFCTPENSAQSILTKYIPAVAELASQMIECFPIG